MLEWGGHNVLMSIIEPHWMSRPSGLLSNPQGAGAAH